MKAPAFAYAKPQSREEVFDLLERHGDGARILAGGQSLLATLNMRLSAPEVLIDITGVPGLSGIFVDRETLRIGALTTHTEVLRSPDVAKHLPLIAQAVPHIAHVAIRNVGTFGGSIAMADPAAEHPACALALDATFVLAGRRGERRIRATDFFKSLYETALAPDELLVAGEFPANQASDRDAFIELTRRHGDYAIVGIAAHAKVERGGFSNVRLAFLNVASVPMLARNAAAAVEGKAFTSDVAAAAQAALSQDFEPRADIYTSAASKLHLARVLTGRALAALAA